MGVAAVLTLGAKEDDEHGPRHVQRAEERGQEGKNDEYGGQSMRHCQEDFILAPEAGEDRNAPEGQRADAEHRGRQWHGFAQTTDATDIHIAVGSDAVHNATGS